MIIIKSKHEVDLMRESGKVTGFILGELNNVIKPGISTMDIDNYVESTIQKNGMVAAFKGYNGFPASACVSINDELIHGIPSRDRIINSGDIVSVDIGCVYRGCFTDAARTYAVGEITEEKSRLIDATEQSFFECLKVCTVGNRISDISHAIQKEVEKNGFSIIRDYVGHGVGKKLHEEPPIPNHGKPNRGARLAPFMTLAIEPMTSAGNYEVDVLLDNWTVVTVDGTPTAHYENTVLITDGEPELLTL